MAEDNPDFELTKCTPYLALIGGVWGVFCGYLGTNWQSYDTTALYQTDFIVYVLTIVTLFHFPLM